MQLLKSKSLQYPKNHPKFIKIADPEGINVPLIIWAKFYKHGASYILRVIEGYESKSDLILKRELRE